MTEESKAPKIDTLELNRETIADLTELEVEQAKGGAKCPDPTETCQSCFCISIRR
jgi:hypothetical protein